MERTLADPHAPVPVIDVGALVAHGAGREAVGARIGAACRTWGFFYIVGHRVDQALQERLERLSRAFFAQDIATKLEIDMARGGRAWRGYFPVGRELTSGRPDRKEGIYFGAELDAHHPLVRARAPLHGRNLFPANIPGFEETVLAYMRAMTRLGHSMMEGLALSLGLEETYFARRYTFDPLTLFRVFNYPPDRPAGPDFAWGVGEHTDYGVLTILKQDDAGGLELKSRSGWVKAPPVPGSFVCNIGDMLDRMTGGLYRSTPHRVRNPSTHDRLSFPFFFDPNWCAEIAPFEHAVTAEFVDDRADRWDHESVHEFRGTYGEYVLSKVTKVFPELSEDVI